MGSRIGNLTRGIAAGLAGMSLVPAANVPQVWWTPEWERAELQKIEGVFLAVFPFGSEPDLATRGGGSLGDDMQTVHVAACKVRTRTSVSAAEQFDDGDDAVAVAEQIVERLLGMQLVDTAGVGWRCVAVEHDPVISADYAREHRMWVSYVKCTWISD